MAMDEVISEMLNEQIETMADSPLCIIDSETRTITVPAEYQLLGVENDKRVERIYFQCPKIVGDNQDLSQGYQLFINYQNANGDPDAYHINDMIVEDDNITFSWLLEENVTKYRGNIQFAFGAIKPGDEAEDPDKNRWNTTINTDCTCLVGLKCTQQVAESNPDALVQIWAAIDELKSGGGGSGTPGKDGREIEIRNNGTAIQWRYVGDSDWTDLVQLSDLKGEKGDKGDKGEKGDAGEQGNQGPKGDTGATPDIQIGTVQTLEPGQQATASMTGTPENPLLNLGIPKGEKGEGGGSAPPDYQDIKENSESVWIDQTLTYSIADNRADIFDALENSKASKMSITDASEYWDADSSAEYPSVLSMKRLRECRFYREMWLPNGLDMSQSYRYSVDKNGQIRLYDINAQKSDFASFLPWGMCLKGEGKEFPVSAIHFVVSSIRVLGWNNTTGAWELALKTPPSGSMYIVEQTNEEEEITDEVERAELPNGYYQFTIQPEQWKYENSASQYNNGDMCFHFFGTSGIVGNDMKKYDKVIVSFRMAILEEEYADVFTVSCGADAWGTVETITEAFFGRFNPVKQYICEYSSNNVLEGEYDIITSNMTYIDELLSDNTTTTSGGGGSSYVLPIMSVETLGGGKAVQKTSESVPVAIDENGQLFVPNQSGGGSAVNLSPYDGKTIVMFGDSIVAGWGWQEGYGISKPLQEQYPNATWVNNAKSGESMAGDSSNAISARIKAYSGNADYILVEGGTNDNSNSVPIGTIANGYDAQYDVETFSGALESALQYIMDTYPLARKFFLIPHSFAKDNSYVDDFHDRAKEICEKWNMPVLDMRNMAQIAMTNANKALYTRNPNTNQGDGVHPTETWYRAFYSPVVDQFMRSLGTYSGNVDPPEHVAVTSVTLNQNTLMLTQSGQTVQLIATIYPSNASNKAVTWESTHVGYATVSQSGVVKAIANGVTTVTVKTQDGNKIAQCQVTVNISEEPSEQHTELDSLEFDENCYFDIGSAPNINTDYDLSVKINSLLTSGGTMIFGARDTENGYKYSISGTDNLYFTRGAISSRALSTTFWGYEDGTWRFKSNKNVVNITNTKDVNTSVTLDQADVLTSNYNMYVGNVNEDGDVYGTGFSGEFYYLKIYSSGVLVSDIVPVKKTDGTLCLYDKIKHAYLYNLGTGKIAE